MQSQGSSQSTLGIVPVGLGETKDGHDGIAYKFFECAPMLSHYLTGMGIVAAHQSAYIFRIKGIAKRSGFGDIGEEDRDQFSLFRHACFLWVNRAAGNYYGTYVQITIVHLDCSRLAEDIQDSCIALRRGGVFF